MSGRRIELSATQVIASMLAAVTGAVAASYTGIGGTVIGVAVMSVASTAGGAVYQHYLGRSKERLRSAAVVVVPLATFHTAAGHRGRRPGEPVQAGESARARGDRAQAAGGQTRAPGNAARKTGESTSAAGDRVGAADATAHEARAAGELSSWPWSPDSAVTEAFPAISGEAGRWSDPPAETAGLTGSQITQGSRRAGQAEVTQELDSGTGTGTDHEGSGNEGTDHGDTGNEDPASGADREPAGPAGPHGARRRWLTVAGAAVGVFVLTLGGITAFEVAAGKPLDALIWGRSSVGTTIGSATGTQHSRPAPSTTPHRASPSPSHSPTGSPTPTPSPSSSSPTPTPTPTPTRSPSPSPSPSVSASAPVSPNPSASAKPSKTAAP